MDGPNGSGWWAWFWHAARNEDVRHLALALAAAGRPDWLTHRIIEGCVIAIMTSALTTGAGYAFVVTRIDERQSAMQRDMDGRTAARKEADVQTNARVERLEAQFLAHEAEIVKQLAGIREQLGRIDGRTDRTWRRDGK